MTKYLGLAESNRLLRKALAEHFPGVRFTIRGKSYSGGSSTRVCWTDGPTTEQVEKIARPFGHAGFDGMIDMQYDYDQYILPNGQIVTAGTRGTGGSRGSVPAFENEKPACAEPIRSGIGYVFCDRDISDDFVAAVQKCYSAKSGEDRCAILNKLTHGLRFITDLNDHAEIAKVLARQLPAKRAA